MQRTLERARVVSVRLTRSEHAAAQAEAQAAGAPLGAWLRMRMLDSEDSRERFAAIEARLAELNAALEKLERAVEKNFGRLAEAVRARPASGAGSTPRPVTNTAPAAPPRT